MDSIHLLLLLPLPSPIALSSLKFITKKTRPIIHPGPIVLKPVAQEPRQIHRTQPLSDDLYDDEDEHYEKEEKHSS